MQEETVDFKLDVSDESIKRSAMKVFWMFSGVTFVDIKEKGQVKVRGNFDKYVMETLLQEIDKSVEIINPMQKPEQNHSPFISSISSYFNSPKVEEIAVILEFEVLNERIKPEAMEVIWEFSGITSVEVVENRLVKVKGEKLKKVEMETTLKKIDKSVKIVRSGTDVEAKPEVKQAFHTSFIKGSSDAAGSAKGPTQAPMFGAAGARGRALEAAEKAKVATPVNKLDQAMNLPQGRGFGAQINPQPPKKQEKAGFIGQIQDWMKPNPQVKKEQHERGWGHADPYARRGPYDEKNHCYGDNPYARLANSSTSKTGETSSSSSSSMGNSYQSRLSSDQMTSSQHSQSSGSMRDQRSRQTESRFVNSVKSSSSFSSQSRK